MAAAARSASPDVRDAATARVPCPHCGGLIHPIAGKCKHCKADLTAYRAARPAAGAPLPALALAAAAHPPHAPHSNGQSPPYAAHAPIAHAVTLPPAAQPVLPPRPTSRSEGEPGATAWRSWPVVVIVIAALAIVAAVVVMVWPAGHGRDGKRALQPPPAPERMDTQTPPVTPKLEAPQPHAAAPSAPRDPWAQPSPAAPGADPPQAQDPTAQADPSTDDDASGAIDPVDPSTAPLPSTPAPSRGRGHPAINPNAGSMLTVAITARLCRKLAQCGTSDPVLQSACDAISSLPSDLPAGCPAAVRCLRHIDTMGCSSQPGALQIGVLLAQFRDCADAVQC